MKKLTLPLLMVTLFFASCSVEEVKESVDPTTTIDTTKDYVLVNQVYQEIGNNLSEAVVNAQSNTAGKPVLKSSENGPEITIEPFDYTTFPKTITLDFKDGITGEDGVTRKGIVTIVSTNWYGEENSEHTATFQDYYHNDNKIEGTHYVKNVGMNNDQFLGFEVVVENGKITTKANQVISYEQNTVRTWIEGSDTPTNIFDDEYLLEGTQSGTSSTGISYSIEIEEALHFVLLKRSFESGIVKLSVGKIKNVILNYTESTITILGITYPFIF